MITITEQIAHECADALVSDYNNAYERLAPSNRLIWFRGLYKRLKALEMGWMIANAYKPEDFPQDMWFEK